MYVIISERPKTDNKTNLREADICFAKCFRDTDVDIITQQSTQYIIFGLMD